MSGEAMRRQQNEAARGQSEASRRVSPVPEGFGTVTLDLIVSDLPQLVDFVRRVFDAGEISRSSVGSSGGSHSEVRVGNFMLMIGGGGPGLSWKGVATPTAFHVFVQDADARYSRALEAGATSIHPVIDQSYGDRIGGAKDPFGNTWFIATHIRDAGPLEPAVPPFASAAPFVASVFQTSELPWHLISPWVL